MQEITPLGTYRSVAFPAELPVPHSMRDVLGVILRAKTIVLTCLLMGLAFGMLYLYETPPVYQASADVLIDGRTSPVSSRESLSSSTPLEISEIESQVELIRSAKLVKLTLDSLPAPIRAELDADHPTPLARLQGLKASVVGSLKKIFGIVEVSGPPGDDTQRRIDFVRGNLLVRRVGASYVIEVSYSANDPKVAAAVANGVAAAFVVDQVQGKSDMWRRASAWMQQRLADLESQASSSARLAQEFKSSHRIVDTGSRGLVNEQQLQEINTALLDARAKTVEAASKLAESQKILAVGGDGLVPDTLTDEVVAKLRTQAADLRQKKAQLEAMLGPTHQAVIKTDADLTAIQTALRSEVQHLAQALKSNYDVAVVRQASLEKSFADVIASSGVTSLDQVQAKELDRSADAYNTLYSGLLQRYADAVNQQSFPIATAQVISDATVPTSPSSPRSFIVMLCSLIAGAGGGTAAAFARETVDKRLSSGHQVEQLGVPCYGTLPKFEQEPLYRIRHASKSSISTLSGQISLERLKGEFYRHAPTSLFSHSVQAVKTHIVLAGSPHSSRVIGITSSRSGEGKSTVASNLAFLFSHPERNTLLIDGDIYNPTLSDLLDSSPRAGLTDILLRKATLDEAIFNVPDTSLAILSAGQFSDTNIDHMLGSREMRDLLSEVRERFDVVIVDLPPVGEVVATREIAPMLDGVVVVATWQKTKVSALQETLRCFASDGARVFGVILNRAAARSIQSRDVYEAYANRVRTRPGS